MRILSTIALAAFAAAGFATAADARRVTVDNDILFELGGCTLDERSRDDDLCQPVDLGFTIGVTTIIDEEFGNTVENFRSVVLYDEGFISFGGEVFSFDPDNISTSGRPVIAANFAEVDFLPSGQFVVSPSDVIRGKDTFEVSWYRAVLFSCEEDEEDLDCVNPFIKVKAEPPHARLLIQSLPKNSARFTLSWTEGASAFGYWLGEDVVRELGGNGERRFQFIIGSYVPEPASWAMMIAGFGLVGAAARQRRRSSTGWRPLQVG